MNRKNRRSPLFGMVTAAALSLLLVGPALAETTSTTVSVTGGTRTLSVPATTTAFTAVEINGTSQPTTTALDFTVSDFTGTGAGWAVTASATQFAGSGTAAGKTLPVNSLSLSASAVTPQDDAVAGPTGAAAANLDDSTDKTISSADGATDQGMGEYDHSGTLTLTVPGNVFAGSYSSTITLTVAVPV